ncbi:hypothetical protein JCGZ_04557 [Jatropha curcas]|uniref:Uncharacterized protein n=1 Tax=Jatropha curcas TaxID=180498 RepID=A0A067LGZ9_JATCU|nr:hypothetical protein JCGZ_04557 [Jatropha curcas]
MNRIKQYQENDHVIRFLKGLNDQFNTVKSQILLLDPLPAIDNKVFPLVLQQERQINDGSFHSIHDSTLSEAKAFVNKRFPTDAKSFPKPKQSFQMFNYKGSTADNRFCTYCGQSRHTIDTCYKKHEFPPGYGSKQKLHIVYANNVTNNAYFCSASRDNGYSVNFANQEALGLSTNEALT